MLKAKLPHGLEIAYSKHTSARPEKGVIVLLHGVFGQGRDWINYQYNTHLADYTLICIDLLGHGDSSKPTNVDLYDPEIQANHIAAVLEQEEISSAIIWGYSYGARMAAAFSLQHPEKTESLIMGGMHPYPVDNVFDSVRQRKEIISNGMEAWVNHLTNSRINLDTYTMNTLLEADYLALNTVDDAILTWEGFNNLDHLYHTEFPILLYLGEKDISYLPKAEEFVDKNEEVKLLILAEKNHFSAFFDSREICKRIEAMGAL